MRNFARVVLPLAAIMAHASCNPPGAAPVAGERIAPVRREGHVEAGGGVRLFYRIVGASRDTVVVIHGGPGLTMDYLAADLEPLAMNHALLFYDQRGTGGSSLVTDSTHLAAQRFAEDLEALRAHFKLERMTILGHSWGAGVAALYAGRHSERVARLVIVNGIPARRGELVRAFEKLDASRDSAERHRMREWRQARLANPGDAAACRAYYVLWFRPFFGVSNAASRSKGDFCAGTPEARRNKISSVDKFTMASLGEWDWRPSLRAVTAPALVIHGTADVLPVEGAREWAAALPNARLLLLEGVGHFPYLEAPERFFAALDEFLQGRWPEDSRAITAP